MAKLWDELAGRNSFAYFVCALSICWPCNEENVLKIKSFEGKIDGKLIWPPRGDRGFGYDPMFVPKGFDISFGEFLPADKHAISHRARAFEKFTAACFS